MKATPPDPIQASLKQIVALLVSKRYGDVEEITRGTRLAADDMSRAIREYGRTLILPPDSAFNDLDALRSRAAEPPHWSVRFDLWTLEEGRSDLTLELTLIEEDQGTRIELDDIHVL